MAGGLRPTPRRVKTKSPALKSSAVLGSGKIATVHVPVWPDTVACAPKTLPAASSPIRKGLLQACPIAPIETLSGPHVEMMPSPDVGDANTTPQSIISPLEFVENVTVWLLTGAALEYELTPLVNAQLESSE